MAYRYSYLLPGIRKGFLLNLGYNLKVNFLLLSIFSFLSLKLRKLFCCLSAVLHSLESDLVVSA